MTKAANESTAPRNSNHPPLARDAQGNLLALPENTAGFRIKRHTGGRPKTILAPDRSPVRLPLDTTPEDVAEMFGAGTYRLDAIDEVGQPLDYLTTLVIGAEGGEAPAGNDAQPAIGSAPRPTAASDLRFALETITQITRAQSDSLRRPRRPPNSCAASRRSSLMPTSSPTRFARPARGGDAKVRDAALAEAIGRYHGYPWRRGAEAVDEP